MLLTAENIPFLIGSLAFIVIGLLSLGAMIYLGEKRYRRRMLKKLRTTDEHWGMAESEFSGLDREGQSGNTLIKLLSIVGMRTSHSQSADYAGMKLKFLRAGLRHENAGTVFLGTKFLLAVTLPITFLVIVIFFFKGLESKYVLLGCTSIATIGVFIPNYWLQKKISVRKEKLIKAFPDALDMMIVCVEAGMGMDAATRRVGDELKLSHPELSKEFDLLNLELRAGMARKNALGNLAKRTDIDDVNSLVTLLIQTDRFGTSVAQALRVFADSFRTARFQRAEEAAAKISTKLIFPLALFIFPSFFLVAAGPAAIKLFQIFIKG